MRIAGALLGLLILGAASVPAAAGGYRTVEWAELKAEVYGEREVLPGEGAVFLEAPRRAADDRRVPVEVSARMPDGSLIRSVTIIIDENPMPVSAVFEFAEPQVSVKLAADMRMNGPSPVRAVVETTDGRLLMTERLVKTSGLGACAAPPVGDPEEAISAIGQMQAHEAVTPGQSSAARMVRLEMKHPQHTGMQMDQITLHYILARYVEKLEVAAAGQPLFTLTGSISLSEDPAVTFAVEDREASRIEVRMTDTEGTVIERALAIGPES